MNSWSKDEVGRRGHDFIDVLSEAQY